jgi:hypothetical protein
MSTPSDRDGRLVRFLLGDMHEAERAEVERQLLTEDGFEDELIAVRDEVLEDYLQHALPAEERARVETHLLTAPSHRRRLAFIQDMLAAAERVPIDDAFAREGKSGARAPSAWLCARAAVATLALGAGVLAVLWRYGESASSAGRPPTVPVASSSQERRGSPQVSSPERSTEASAVVHLPEKPTGVVAVSTPGGAQTLRVVIPVAARSSFDAVLRASGGREVWRAEGLVRSKADHVIELAIPARILVAADYTLSVESELMRDPDAPARIELEYRLRVRRTPDASPH